MQQGIPCISTNEGGIGDIIDDGETGFVVERQNPSLFAEKIEVLLNDKQLREEMATAGNKKFEEHFTLNKFEERLSYVLSLCCYK